MHDLTLNDVYELLGIPSIYERYLETGKLPYWNCSESEKLDIEFGEPEFEDGKLIIDIKMTFDI